MGSSDSKRARSPETPTAEKRKVLRVWLLGGFRVSVGSRAIAQHAWRLRKAAALVKLLALAPGHGMHRKRAMEALWPEASRTAASNSLRTTLYTARKILEPEAASRYLASEGESLLLCPEGDLWVDADAFEEAATTARRSTDPAAYRAAIDLYAGELLPEDRYEEWTEGRREQLRQLYLALLVALAGLHEERREYEPAIDVLRRATAEEPTFEEGSVELMRLHALTGRPERAIAQYERLRDTLCRGLGVEPAGATRHLRDEIAAGRLLPTPFVGTSHDEQPPRVGKHNLPAPRTSFVGREREMLEAKRLVPMTRLLTFAGAGGSGKTRMALEVAGDLIGAYPNGVWMVALAPSPRRGW
jgi:DNA-binding SARP family transcriptional activator